MKNIVIVGADKGIGLKILESLQERYLIISVSDVQTISSFPAVSYFLDVFKDGLTHLTNLPDSIHGLIYCPASFNMSAERFTTQELINNSDQHLLATIEIIHSLLPRLTCANGSSIVLLSTIPDTKNVSGAVLAAKRALKELIKSMSLEFECSGIRLNVLAPPSRTRSLSSLLNGAEDVNELMYKQDVLQPKAELNLLEMVDFLMSEESSSITGQMIDVSTGVNRMNV